LAIGHSLSRLSYFFFSHLSIPSAARFPSATALAVFTTVLFVSLSFSETEFYTILLQEIHAKNHINSFLISILLKWDISYTLFQGREGIIIQGFYSDLCITSRN